MLKYIKAIFFCLPTLIYSYFTWLLPWSLHKDKIPIEKRFYYVQRLIKKVFKYFNLRINYDDYRKFLFSRDLNKNYFYVLNHLSNFDPLLLIILSNKPITFAAKIELTKMIFIGRIIYLLDGIFLDREDLKQQIKEMKKVENSLKNNHSLDWCIFPEGTRNKKPLESTLEFKHGSFRPAFKSNTSIVILTIYGTFRIFDAKIKEKYNPIDISLIEVIKIEQFKDTTTNDLAIDAYNKINKELIKLRTINDERFKNLNA